MRFVNFGQMVQWVGATLAVVVLAACSGDVTGSRSVNDPRGIYTLPVLEVTTCQYGGEYPFCRSAPPADDPGPSGGGSEPDSTATCNPSVDPKCEQELTSADSMAILNSLNQFLRPDSTVRDTTQRRLCAQMRDRFRERFDADKVFRGAYDSQGGDAHYGAMLSGHIHFDPWLLGEAAKGYASAMRELANTALHEAAHVIGYQHPNGADANSHYTDPPFNLLDPGPNACLR